MKSSKPLTEPLSKTAIIRRENMKHTEKCSCPWCPRDAITGCQSMISGTPTCEEHDYRAVFNMEVRHPELLVSDEEELRR